MHILLVFSIGANILSYFSDLGHSQTFYSANHCKCITRSSAVGFLRRSEQNTGALFKRPQSPEFCNVWSYSRSLPSYCCSPCRKRQNFARTRIWRTFLVLCLEGDIPQGSNSIYVVCAASQYAGNSSTARVAARGRPNGRPRLEWLGVVCRQRYIWYSPPFIKPQLAQLIKLTRFCGFLLPL